PPMEVFGSTVGIGATSLIVTRTGGPPWTTFSLGLSSGEVATAMREIDANTILIGTNAGRMLRVSWTGTTWRKVVLTSPAPRYISCIAVDPSNPQRFWVTLSQVGGAMVYRSDNAGTAGVAAPACPRALNRDAPHAVRNEPDGERDADRCRDGHKVRDDPPLHLHAGEKSQDHRDDDDQASCGERGGQSGRRPGEHGEDRDDGAGE